MEVLAITTISAAAWLPSGWAQGVKEGWILYTNQQPSTDSRLPSVGNGFVSTIVGSDDVYMAGVFNSRDSPQKSHRARLPSAHRLAVTMDASPSVRSAWALDTRNGCWLERHDSDIASVERRFYAHQQIRGLLVSDYTIRASTPVNLSINASQADPARWLQSVDFAFGSVQRISRGASGFAACTHAAETGSPGWNATHKPAGCTNVSVVYSTPPTVAVLAAGLSRLRFVSAHASNLSDPQPWQAALAAHASAIAAGEELYASHAAAWAALYDASTSGGSVSVHGPHGESVELTRVVAASYYALLSAARADWPHGLSPGGLSTDGYEGHTFWDQETWMVPPLLAVGPTDLAASLLRCKPSPV